MQKLCVPITLDASKTTRVQRLSDQAVVKKLLLKLTTKRKSQALRVFVASVRSAMVERRRTLRRRRKAMTWKIWASPASTLI